MNDYITVRISNPDGSIIDIIRVSKRMLEFVKSGVAPMSSYRTFISVSGYPHIIGVCTYDDVEYELVESIGDAPKYRSLTLTNPDFSAGSARYSLSVMWRNGVITVSTFIQRPETRFLSGRYDPSLLVDAWFFESLKRFFA